MLLLPTFLDCSYVGIAVRACANRSWLHTIFVAYPALLKGAVLLKVSAIVATSAPNESTMPRTRSRKFSLASSSDPAAS